MSLLKTISQGLKSLTASPERTVSSNVKQPSSFMVNYEAGGELMHKHEELWKRLFQDQEGTAKKAEDLDVEIGQLFVSCDRQAELLGKLHEEAAGLPILLNQLQETTNSLAGVEELYDQVEAALVHLENVCEEQEFVRNQMSHHKQLAVYKMKKEHELQKYRGHLAREHAAKVDQVNRKKQHLLKEKQSAFEEQFTQDIDHYKRTGKIERLPLTPDSHKKLDLADVDIEDDQDALDAFLASSAGGGGEQEPKSETETEALSYADGPTIEATREITSPSETDANAVVSPEQTQTGSSDAQTAPAAEDQKPNSETETEALSDGDGPTIEATREITPPSETDATAVVSPEQTQTGSSDAQTAPVAEDQSESGDKGQSERASTDEDSTIPSSDPTD